MDAGRLVAERDEHGHRQVNGADLAAFARAQVGRRATAGVSSARKPLQRIVTERDQRALGEAQVEIAAGPYRRGGD
ncbi:hypothetical protein [Nonomuraea dietziae]|uniref:hypothetical protein n=1 Tax=Nonomuraea dietziae TaxID=65515 RepID=UPI0031D58D60